MLWTEIYNDEGLRVRCSGAIREVEFLRPEGERDSALTQGGYQVLLENIQSAADSPDTRVLILRMSNCVGGRDIIPELLDDPSLAPSFTRMTVDVIRAMRGIVTIAVIDGRCMGAHAAIAAAANFRYAVLPDERFRDKPMFLYLFQAVGLSSDDMGAAYHLVRALGLTRATQVLLSRLGAISYNEAADWGFLSAPGMERDSLEVAVLERAEELAEGPPQAIVYSLRALQRAADLGFLDAMAASERDQAYLLGLGRGSEMDIGSAALRARTSADWSQVTRR